MTATAQNNFTGWSAVSPQEASICYLPGLSSADVSLLQSEAAARYRSGDISARNVLLWLLSHRDHTKAVWGTYNPAAFGLAAQELSGKDLDLAFADLHKVNKPGSKAKKD